MGLRNKAKGLPSIKVSKTKFIEMLVETGKSQDEIDLIITTTTVLGSEIMIGDQMVSIAKEE